MQLHVLARPKRQSGAFLVVAIIMLLVLSALGVALMSMAVSASRTSRNYSEYVISHIRSISMAGYAQRIIASYTTGKYPGPGTCTSSVTCNVIDNTFPRNGKPVLPWSSGTGYTATKFKGSETNTWWTTNAFAYENTFAGSGNARVLVTLVGASSTYPFTNTYQIIGYSTSNTGSAPSTFELYTTWNGFRPDPYPTTSGTNMYSSSSCAGGCPYGSCCNGTVCTTTSSGCASANAAFTPDGWLCSEYFVTGKGFSSTTCNNPVAKILDVMTSAPTYQVMMQDYYTSHSNTPPANPNIFGIAGTMTWNGNWYYVSRSTSVFLAEHIVNGMGVFIYSTPPVNSGAIVYMVSTADLGITTLSGYTNLLIVYRYNLGATWTCYLGGGTHVYNSRIPPYCT